MIYNNADLHNIAELLPGSGEDVVPDAARAHLAEASPDRPLGDWGAAGDNGLWCSRIPDSVRRRLNAQAQLNAVQATGAELRFNLSRDGRARIVLNGITRAAVVEIYAGPFFRDWKMVGLADTEIVVEPPPNADELRRVAGALQSPWDPALTRVLLPWRPPCRLVALEGDFSPPRSEQLPQLRYLAYGSSITHGNTSVRPTAMYASRTAQLLGVDFLNLGFGGGAHLEEAVARHIAERDDWDFASFELGVNLIARIDADEFRHRVDRFVDIILESRRQRPVFFIDLFTCRWDFGDEEMQTRVGEFRRIVRRKIGASRQEGVYHLSGRGLLSGPGGLTADIVHPSPAGMEEIAGKLEAIMRPIVLRSIP